MIGWDHVTQHPALVGNAVVMASRGRGNNPGERYDNLTEMVGGRINRRPALFAS